MYEARNRLGNMSTSGTDYPIGFRRHDQAVRLK